MYNIIPCIYIIIHRYIILYVSSFNPWQDTDFLDFCKREPRKCARPLLRLAEKAELDSAEAVAKGGYGGRGSSETLGSPWCGHGVMGSWGHGVMGDETLEMRLSFGFRMGFLCFERVLYPRVFQNLQRL